MWCIDRRDGQVIHLGGEYTWGDCHAVAAAVQRLVDSGHLAVDGDYAEGVQATSGNRWSPVWLRDHFLAHVPWAEQVLDAHHAWKHLTAFAASVWGKATKAARAFLDKAFRALHGRRRKPRRRRKKSRKGHKKGSAKTTYARRVANRRRWKLNDTSGANLIMLNGLDLGADEDEHRQNLLNYIQSNADRMDYAAYTGRGWQLGSGAMESLHRTASQIRMKRPGPGWLEETSTAVFNLRMLDIVGRWNAFWAHQDAAQLLLTAFGRKQASNS